MRQRGYLIAFVLVLLAAVAGAFLGGWFLIRSLRQEFNPGQTWVPPELTTTPATGQPLPTQTPVAPAAHPTVTRLPPSATSIPASRPQATSTVTAAPIATPTETATPTLTPTVTASVGHDFVLARPVRHSSGDCPGSYILGQITDRSGNPLPGVRLALVDEWGNSASAVSKSGAGEVGRYDFPLFGPRRYYLIVVDAAGRPLSARIEIAHGVGPNAQASCHWADWRRGE